MAWLSFVFALLAGAANPFQAGTNAQLNKQLVSPLWAGAVVYATGLLGMLVLLAIVRPALPTVSQAMAVKPWAWLGGVISIASTIAGLALAQRLGAAVFMGLTVTAALTCSVLLDNSALVGFRSHAATPERVAGCLLMVAGVWLIARF
ncbi:MAG: DMT family transporter [Granulicella sp.]